MDRLPGINPPPIYMQGVPAALTNLGSPHHNLGSPHHDLGSPDPASPLFQARTKVVLTNSSTRQPTRPPDIIRRGPFFHSKRKLITQDEPTIISATRIQKVFRGYIDREKTVLPSQLKPILKTHLPTKSDDEITEIAKVMSKQTLEWQKDPGNHRGEKVRIPSDETYDLCKDLTIKKPDERKKTTISMGQESIYTLSEDGRSIKVQFIPETTKENLLGKGGYKTVFKMNSFIIPLFRKKNITTDSRERTPTHAYEVFIRCYEDTQEDVDKGLKVQSYLHKGGKTQPGVHIPPPSTPFSRFGSVEEWYNCDLSQAINSGGIPLSPTQNPDTIPLTTAHKLKFASDLANTLKFVHEKNVIHRDVKPPNLFLKVMEDGEVKLFLADFDLVQEGEGGSEIKSDYYYWDRVGTEGYVTKSSDTLGFALSVTEMFFPGFHTFYDKYNLARKSDQEIVTEILTTVSTSLQLSRSLITSLQGMTYHLFSFPENYPVMFANLKDSNPDKLVEISQLEKEFQAQYKMSKLVRGIIKRDLDVKNALHQTPKYLFFNNNINSTDKKITQLEDKVERERRSPTGLEKSEYITLVRQNREYTEKLMTLLKATHDSIPPIEEDRIVEELNEIIKEYNSPSG